MTIGLFRPLVILPEKLFEALDPRGLRDVLVHEFAHALRRDPLVGFLQRLAAAVYWPYPPVHLLNRRLTWAREEVCDNYVLQQGDPPSYAETLLTISQTIVHSRVRPAALGLFHPRGRLEQRVAGLLNPRRNVMVRTHRVTLAVLMALFLSAVVVVAGTRLLRAEPPGAPLAPADSKPPASPAAPAGLKPSVERDVASESPHRYLDVATIDYAGAPWGYDVKTHSDANTSETELSILFGTEQTASSPKEFRVLARDREGKLHEPRWLLFERGPMTATGAGRKVHTVTIVSRFSLPPKEIASLLIQQSAEPESPSKSAAEHAKAAANASPEQPPQDLHRIQPLDVLRIRALGTIEDQRIDGNFLVEPDGQVALGPSYGRAQVKGLTLEAAEKAIREKLKEVLAEPYVQVTLAGWKNIVGPVTGPK
jgi:hypothetical protein